MNNSKIHYENWQAFLKWSLEMNMERWNISSDLKMLHKHFPLRALTKCKIYLSNMVISPSDCIAYGFQKNWWYCSMVGKKQLVQHKAEEQVWYFRKPIFSPNVFWTHYSKKKFTLLLTKELFAITMTVMK